MEVLNLQERFSCQYSACAKSLVIEVCKLDPGIKKKSSPKKNKIVFILEGDLEFRYNDLPEKTAQKGDFFFIPSNGQFDLTALNKSVVVFIRLPGGGIICESYNVEKLYKNADEKDYHGSDINILKANSSLWYFFQGVNRSVENGLNCRCYFDNKIKEMLIILKASYPRKELQSFFSLILSPNMAFMEYVRANHGKYKTVAEFAGAMNMTPKNFSIRFAKVFGETPQHWMAKEKAKVVYTELCSGNKTIMQIADEQGFSSQQHLYKFCQREFGKNPKEIRNRENV